MAYEYPLVQSQEWDEVEPFGDRHADLIVVGGGLSGVAAACAARRSGVEVCLVEPTHMLGGQAGPAGVSTTDLTKFYVKLVRRSGLWGEFEDRLTRLYEDEVGLPVNAGQYSDNSLTPNPRAVDLVLGRMCADYDVHVLRNSMLLEIEGNQAGVRLTTSRGCLSARLAIDATEDGWVVQRAGTPYRVGNTIVPAPSEDSGLEVPPSAIQSITQVAILRRYDEGLPDELRLERKPPRYSENRRRIWKHYPNAPWQSRIGENAFAGYRGLPDTEVLSDFLIDASVRRSLTYRATLRTLAIIYYLQVELGLPWSVVTDEGFADGPARPLAHPRLKPFSHLVQHFPPMPYIRESARVVGAEVVTGKDIFRSANRREARWRHDVVAVGTYPADLHGGREPEDFESYLGESIADKPSRWAEGPFAIPLGTLVPQRDDWFIAAEKNISASRLAASASRVHPTVFGIGQAAGVLAGLALTRRVAPRRVPTLDVQVELARQGVVLTPLTTRDVEPGDERFVPVSLAVVHGLIDAQVARPSGREPELVLDLELATRRGEALLTSM
jgi:hypothetical protein